MFPYFEEDFAPSKKMQEVKAWLMETDITEHFQKEINSLS